MDQRNQMIVFIHSESLKTISKVIKSLDVGKMWGKNKQKRHPSYLEWRLV